MSRVKTENGNRNKFRMVAIMDFVLIFICNVSEAHCLYLHAEQTTVSWWSHCAAGLVLGR